MGRILGQVSASRAYQGSLVSDMPYNRVCAQCCDRWTDGEKPEGMDGVTIEMETCGKCKGKRRFTELKVQF